MVKFQCYKTFYQYKIYLKSKSIFQKFIIKIKFLTKKMIKNLELVIEIILNLNY